jgi:hypothetical protein
LRWADPPSKESYRLCKKDYETEEEARAQQRAVGPVMNELIFLDLMTEIWLADSSLKIEAESILHFFFSLVG